MSQVIEGIIQGITEFLPISSSGHIVFLEKFANFSSDNLAQIQVALHLGTLFSIIIYYFESIKEILLNVKKNRHFISFIALGTLPLIFMYLFFYDYFKDMHNNIEHAFQIASYCIFITGVILLSTKFINESNNSLTYKIVFIIGCMQCLAILPGISRSGITICSALVLGVSNKEAVRFSFFLAIPAILGASILEVSNLIKIDSVSEFPLIGFLTSLIVGYISLRLLIFISNNGKIWYFSIYCFIIGLVSIFFF